MVQSPFTLLLRGHKNGLHSNGALRRQQASTNLAGMAKAAFLEIDEADEFDLGITSAEVEVVAEDMGDSPISMPVTLSSPTGSARTPDTDGGPEYLCMLTAFSKRRSRRNNGRM